jgi:NADPH:quinone reductase-like Zn-dependent oxidoreductase
MLGCVVGRLGGAPELAEWPRPGLLPGQALVKVSVAALNPIDLLISAGKHPAGVPPVPHVPGIEAVGSTVESDHHAAGTRVRVSVAGGYVSGALAEYVTVPDPACVPVTAELADDQAAAIGVVGISALISLRDRVGVGKGESVLVLGATGALGRASLQVARRLGADRIIAAGRDPERLAALGALADGTVLLGADEPAGSLRARLDEAGGPVNVVVDPLAGPYAPRAVQCLAPGGRYLNVGDLAGPAMTVESGWLRHGGLTLTGFSGASVTPGQGIAAYGEVALLAASGTFGLPVRAFPASRVGEAWAAQSRSPGAKVVVTF